MWGIKTVIMKGLGLISFTKISTLIPQLIDKLVKSRHPGESRGPG
jgi:hypothetical protein